MLPYLLHLYSSENKAYYVMVLLMDFFLDIGRMADFVIFVVIVAIGSVACFR